MPAQSKHDTIARMLELLKVLPHREWATARDLHQHLLDCGYDIDLRSVQRDLRELRDHFPNELELNDRGRPHGWRWSSAAGGFRAMTMPEALVVTLVQQHLEGALPASMLSSFAPLFDRAREHLARHGARTGAARWPECIRSVEPGLHRQPPEVLPEVQNKIAAALLEKRQVQAWYVPGGEQDARSYRLNPIGLMLRGSQTYLVASKHRSQRPQTFAMHRFEGVEVLPESSQWPGVVSLDDVLRVDGGQFGIGNPSAPKIDIEFECDASTAHLLSEAPLEPNQSIETLESGRAIVRAWIPDSWELRWWLMSRADTVELRSPESLRQEIRKRVLAGARLYREAAEPKSTP